jgi:hypothetical protein
MLNEKHRNLSLYGIKEQTKKIKSLSILFKDGEETSVVIGI